MAGRFQTPNEQFLDENGNPYAGGKLEFFESGTSTPQDTFSDDALSVANTNPVILNDAGRAGDIFLLDTDYKVVLKAADDTVIWSADPVRSSSAKSSEVRNVSTTTQLDSSDDGKWIAADATAGSFIITLPAAATAGNGYEVTIQKVDSSANVVTVDGSGSETINGDPDVSLENQYQAITLRCDGTKWLTPLEEGRSLPPSYIDGLIISNGAAPATDVAVSAGSTRSDDDNANIVLPSAITKKLNSAFAEGNNQGGLDTGTVAADTDYYVWDISKADDTADVLLSLSSTSPALPSGFVFKQLNGKVRTDGSSNIITGDFMQVIVGGRKYTSAEQDITASGSLSLSHGLGAAPEIFLQRLVCKTAELNYAVGDELIAAEHFNSDAANNKGLSTVVDSSNVDIRYNNQSSTFNAVDKTTGIAGTLTNANWKMVVRCRL